MTDNYYYSFVAAFYAVVSGASWLAGTMFEVDPFILIAAGAGSTFGVAFTKTARMRHAAGWIITGVVFVGFGLPMLMAGADPQDAGALLTVLASNSGAQKGVAFFGTLFGIGFRRKVGIGVGLLVDMAFRRAGNVIGGDKQP